jgi:hypothetical protein
MIHILDRAEKTPAKVFTESELLPIFISEVALAVVVTIIVVAIYRTRRTKYPVSVALLFGERLFSVFSMIRLFGRSPFSFFILPTILSFQRNVSLYFRLRYRPAQPSDYR